MEATYPGSFDPVHNGHIDVIKRAAWFFNPLTVLVCINGNKQGKYLFEPDERVELISQAIKDVTDASLWNVTVETFTGPIAQRNYKEGIIIKGIRGVGDCESEAMQARFNRELNEDCETYFLPCSREFIDLSSSTVKEMCRLGLWDMVEKMVPLNVAYALRKKFSPQK